MKKILLLITTSLPFAFVSHAQNVGIGNTNPHTKLEVTGAISSTPSSAPAAATVTIPNNVSIFRLTAVAGTQANALSMASPQEGQYLTIYNEDNDTATFAGQTIIAATGVSSFEYINGGWRLVSSSQSNRTITGTTHQVDVVNGNGQAGNPTLNIDSTYTESVKAGFSLSGGGNITFDNSYNLNWDNRFIVISSGVGPHFAGAGFFDINMPALGTTIKGAGGQADISVSSAGIPMQPWNALYYILPIGSDHYFLPQNLRMAAYNGYFAVPENWVLVALFNGDDNILKLGNGLVMQVGQTWPRYTGQAPLAGGNGYIQNQNTALQTADYNISGNAGIGTLNNSATYPANANKLTVVGTQQASDLSTSALKLEQYYVDMGGSNLYGPSMMFNTNNNVPGSTWNCGAIAGTIGTPGNTTDYPGGLAFLTKGADGATTGLPIERMRIDHLGNVGIGTASPTQTLDVAGNGRFNSGGGNYVYIGAGGGGLFGDGGNLVTQIPTGGSFYMSNVTVDGTRVSQSDGTLRVGGPDQTSSNLLVYGKAGIGTLTPANKLDVNGAVAIGSYAGVSAPANSLIVSGKVGIGVNNPSNPLEVGTNLPALDQSVSGGTLLAVLLSDFSESFTAGATGPLSSVAFLAPAYSSSISLTVTLYAGAGNGGTVLATTTYSAASVSPGMVTISFASPASVTTGSVYTFRVQGTMPVLMSNGAGYTGGGLYISGSPNPGLSLVFQTYVSVPTAAYMLVSSSGNVGINNTSPSQKLDVAGTTKTTNFQMTSGATNGYILKSDASGNASWVSSSSIGTTNTLGSSANTITSIVNGVAATALAVNTNALSLAGTSITSTVNGVASGALDISSVDKNIYNSDGTLTGARTVTMGANNLAFTTTSGHVGIGTATPGTTLDVAGQIRSTLPAGGGGSASAIIAAGSTSAGYGWYTGSGGTDQKWWDALSNSSGSLLFRAINDANSGGTNWLQVTRGTGTAISSVTFPNGFVGIGNTAPATALHIGNSTTTTSTYLTIDAATAQQSAIQFNSAGVSSWIIYRPGTTQDLRFYNSGGDRFTITAAGNVGIGPNAPAHALDVTGDINSNTGFTYNSVAPSGSYLRGNGFKFVSSTIQAADIPAGNGNYIQNQFSGPQSSNFYISGLGEAFGIIGYNYLSSYGTLYVGGTSTLSNTYVGGTLGIGISNPVVPLDVESTYGGNVATQGSGYRTYFFAGSGGGLLQDQGGASGNVAIKAGGWIWAYNGFMAASDRRIKNVIGYSDPAADLEMLNKIKVTDYTMRDQLASGSRQIKKVIAQQVQEVYPAAVQTSTVPQFIPNIYQPARDYVIADSMITISLNDGICDTKDIKAGSICRFYLSKKADSSQQEIKGTICSLDDKKIVISTSEKLQSDLYDHAFVYGTEISDFLTVDYEAISMLNVSATQELHKKVKALEEENAEIKVLNKKMNILSEKQQADIDKLKASVETLQQLIGAKAER